MTNLLPFICSFSSTKVPGRMWQLSFRGARYHCAGLTCEWVASIPLLRQCVKVYYLHWLVVCICDLCPFSFLFSFSLDVVLPRVEECTQRCLRLTHWNALIVGIAGTTIGMLVWVQPHCCDQHILGHLLVFLYFTQNSTVLNLRLWFLCFCASVSLGMEWRY